jgi:predicted metal-binding membrane protein
MSMGVADAGPARRFIALKAGLVALTVTAWIYVCLEAFGAGPSPMAGTHHGAHHAAHSASLVIWGTLTMWMVMMVAMMVPAVFPWVFTLARLERGSSRGTGDRLTAPAFLAGYFTAWLLFAVSATTLQ